MPSFTISRFEQHAEGFYMAFLSTETGELRVDNSCGCWTATKDPTLDPSAPNQHRSEVLPPAAAEIQRQLRILLDGDDEATSVKLIRRSR
jgi:hypothetical protein